MQAALEQSGILFAECLLVPWSVTVWLGSFICMAERAGELRSGSQSHKHLRQVHHPKLSGIKIKPCSGMVRERAPDWVP